MEPNQMSISQWMKYFNRIDNSAPVGNNWNHRHLNYSHQFNKPSGQFSQQNFSDPRTKNLYTNGIKPMNNQFGSENPFKYNNNINSMTTNFFPNNSNISSFNNSNLNDFGSMFDNNFSAQNWMDGMNYDQFLNQKKKKNKDYSNRPIVFIANIDDFRNGSRDDYESDDSEYDDYDSELDDSEYEDDYEDEYYESQKRPSYKKPYRR
ncbi:hypothetical protein BpHYR1_001298 [Brachionus plicatilis]|uniref:Uncharacterized protein n=1 Tax=Brachionus plicatilis TaxID=10195 RepID=A0A3M7T774_BRAPC|nr:hypothetical protein BpHYR1_001298 [Brachionus plicatilis]